MRFTYSLFSSIDEKGDSQSRRKVPSHIKKGPEPELKTQFPSENCSMYCKKKLMQIDLIMVKASDWVLKRNPNPARKEPMGPVAKVALANRQSKPFQKIIIIINSLRSDALM